MRLIDADEFKKQIAGMAIVNNYAADKANKMCELIEQQPTAYDMDKVVEWLKLNKVAVAKAIDENWKSKYSLIKKKNLKELFEVYTREQIAIVKSGGINQNICQ